MLQAKSNIMKNACEVLNYLEKKTCSLHPTNDIIYILNRLKDGASVNDCVKIIDKKFLEWWPTPDLRKHLEAVTLFSKTNFKKYVN